MGQALVFHGIIVVSLTCTISFYLAFIEAKIFTAEAGSRRVNYSVPLRLCGLLKQNVIKAQQWYSVKVSR